MSLFPKQYLDSLVSIEIEDKEKNKIPIASGFLYGAKINLKDELGQQKYLTFLITNRHVFEDANTGEYKKEVLLRFNAEDKATYYPVKLLDGLGQPIWIKHSNPNVDLAILQINAQIFKKIKYFLFADDLFIIKASDFDEIGISAGDGAYVLGFPRGIRGENKNRVIVRQGIISRIDEETLEKYFFYIDSASFPGNSGGPVISKPEVVAISGTKNNIKSNLIGVISSGETYQDVAISLQTGRARITFEENMGLVRVVPVDVIVELVKPIVDKVNNSLSQDIIDKTDSKEKIEGVKSDVVKE